MVVSQKLLSVEFGKSRSAPQCLQIPRLVVPSGGAMRQWWRHVSAAAPAASLVGSLIADTPLLLSVQHTYSIREAAGQAAGPLPWCL